MNAWNPPVSSCSARAQHVIDALFLRLDVPVEHRHVRAHAEPVRGAVNLEVAIAAALVVRDLPAHALGENLRAAARQRVEPGGHQLAQDLLVGHPVQVGEERDLDGGEALQMNPGTDPFEAAQQLRVVVERQIGMQAVDDVDFGERLVGALPQLVPRLLERHRVGAGVAGLQPRERAEQTAGDADVGRFEPDVVVVVGARAVPLLALAIGEPADGEEIGRLEQPHAVLEVQTLARDRVCRRCPRGREARARPGYWISCTPMTALSGDAEDLHAQRARARAVELRHQNPLPLPEHDFAAADLQRQAVAEQHRAQVRVGVHAIAVRVLRIVVHVLGVAGHHLLEEPLDVGEQRRLKLVDEQRAGRVHRPEADQAFAHVELPDELHHQLGEVDELDALIG